MYNQILEKIWSHLALKMVKKQNKRKKTNKTKANKIVQTPTKLSKAKPKPTEVLSN